MSSLTSVLNIASSALNAEQAAINVTGNNIANVGNANYSREVAELSPNNDVQTQPGTFIGTGVDLTSVQRQVDDALNSRLRNSSSDASAATTTQTWVGQVQSTLNALSGSDLSSQMSTFFTGWSNLANDPTDTGQRQVVIQNGANLANYIQGLNTQLNGLQTSVNQQLPQQTAAANSLASQIASLNVQITSSQGGTGGTANSLQDQRDTDLASLSKLVNITTADQPDGTVNVYVGSQPLVQGQTSRGLSVANIANGSSGSTTPTVVFTDTGGTVPVTSGVLGGLEAVRSQIASATDSINTIAQNLISSVNQLSASGQGTTGFTSVTSTNPVTDPTQPLNSAAAGLTETPTNGSFVVQVTQANGTTQSTLVPVNLNGSGTQTSLNSLATTLNGIAGVSATVANGSLTIKSSTSGSTLSFSQDNSGTLAALGINTFFSGTGAGDIAVNSTVSNQPSLLAAAQNGEPGDNSNALAISKLESQPLTGLNGESLQSSYQGLVNQVANSASAATTNVTATAAVQSTLTSQQQSLSGVSINEETVNLMQQQQAFQAAAQVVTTVNAMFVSMLDAFASVP
jgi:flagellar hook-associated protein 1 FlgK